MSPLEAASKPDGVAIDGRVQMGDSGRHVLAPRPGVAGRIVNVDLVRGPEVFGKAAEQEQLAIESSGRRLAPWKWSRRGGLPVEIGKRLARIDRGSTGGSLVAGRGFVRAAEQRRDEGGQDE